jgi:hypothetical protein
MPTTTAHHGSATYVAFAAGRLLAAGDLITVARAAHALGPSPHSHMPLVFEQSTGRQVDLDLSGSAAELDARYGGGPGAPARPAARRGRPRLGVTGREITLLPTHWRWLDSQRGGASAALRRLVDRARREMAPEVRVREAQDRAYRFMSAIAGDLPGFEEATRALFECDARRFAVETAAWPDDIRTTATEFAYAALHRDQSSDDVANRAGTDDGST